MELYLSALRDALRKKKMETLEIEDIIADHREMIEEALAKGLSSDAITKVFGLPEAVAETLAASTPLETTVRTDGSVSPSETKVSFAVTSPLKILIHVFADTIHIVRSTDEQVHVSAHHDWQKTNHKVVYENGTVSIIAPKADKNSFGWVGGIFARAQHKEHTFTLALPETIECSDFHCETLSGNMHLDHVSANKARLKSISGDLKLTDCQFDTWVMNTVSGDIEVLNLKTNESTVSLISGDAKLRRLDVENLLIIETVSGDITLDEGKTKSLKLRTVSGDLNATEFYPKQVSLRSVSGDLALHNSQKSEIDIAASRSVSGKIKISP